MVSKTEFVQIEMVQTTPLLFHLFVVVHKDNCYKSRTPKFPRTPERFSAFLNVYIRTPKCFPHEGFPTPYSFNSIRTPRRSFFDIHNAYITPLSRPVQLLA